MYYCYLKKKMRHVQIHKRRKKKKCTQGHLHENKRLRGGCYFSTGYCALSTFISINISFKQKKINKSHFGRNFQMPEVSFPQSLTKIVSDFFSFYKEKGGERRRA